MSVTCLTILLTWRCPARCAHCVFDSGPDNRHTLDLEVARAAVDAAARLTPRPSLSFSGGEPFAALPAMRDLLARASGWEPAAYWSDADDMFGLHIWTAAGKVPQS